MRKDESGKKRNSKETFAQVSKKKKKNAAVLLKDDKYFVKYSDIVTL